MTPTVMPPSVTSALQAAARALEDAHRYVGRIDPKRLIRSRPIEVLPIRVLQSRAGADSSMGEIQPSTDSCIPVRTNPPGNGPIVIGECTGQSSAPSPDYSPASPAPAARQQVDTSYHQT